MSESQTRQKPPQGPSAAEEGGVPLSDANRTDGGRETRPVDDSEAIPETFNITLKREVQPADNSKDGRNPYAIDFEEASGVARTEPTQSEPLASGVAGTGPVQSEPVASSVAETEPVQSERGAGDRRAARNVDRAAGAVGGSNPAPVQTAPRGPWFRIVLLLLMLQVLTAVAFWTPATLQEVAASTMGMIVPVDIPQSRTSAGPGPLVGQLEVTSAPSGSKLFVDGEPHGVTPADLILTAGTHEVTLVSPVGTVRRKVRVRPGHRTLFSEAIFPGSLVILSALEVEVRIAGDAFDPSGGDELVLAPGIYELELLNTDGGVQATLTVEILPGQVTTLDADPPHGNDN